MRLQQRLLQFGDAPLQRIDTRVGGRRRWRTLLWRRWSDGPTANFIMLNPSTADETKLDPTCTRAQRYAERWGCGALIVTRASSEQQVGAEMRRQILGNPQPLMLAGGVLLTLAVIPGLPTIPFLVLGSGVGYAGWVMSQRPASASRTVTESRMETRSRSKFCKTF